MALWTPEYRREWSREYYQRNIEKARATSKAYYRENAEARRAYSKAYRERTAARFRDACTGPCVDCGVELPPEVMELDHVRGVKSFTPSRWREVPIPKGMTRAEMLDAEIAKCDLRCPNCHRMRHHRERSA